MKRARFTEEQIIGILKATKLAETVHGPSFASSAWASFRATVSNPSVNQP